MGARAGRRQAPFPGPDFPPRVDLAVGGNERAPGESAATWAAGASTLRAVR